MITLDPKWYRWFSIQFPKKVKRGAAFSGGGNKGQFTVGALRYVAKKEGVEYDHYAGISVGAIIASYLSMFRTTKLGVERMISLFLGVTTKDIHKSWAFGYASGVWRSSFLDSSPLHKLLRSHLDVTKMRTSGKRLTVGAVSLEKGTYETFTEMDEYIVDAVLASAAYPAMYAPVEMRNQLWTDGGVRRVTPIKSLIKAGCDEIDVFICHPPEPEEWKEDRPSGIDVAIRALELMNDQIVWDDLADALRINDILAAKEQLEEAGIEPGDWAKEAIGKRKIQFRVFHPQHAMGYGSLDYDTTANSEMQSLGYRTAQLVVESDRG